MSSLTTRSTVPCSVVFLLTMNQPLPTLFMCTDWTILSYTPFKPSKVDRSVIIFPLARSLDDPYITVVPATPTIIAPINALGKSNCIQNLKITNLCRHLLLDSRDPALVAGVDDNNDEDTFLAGVHGNNTFLAGVPIPTTIIMTNDDNDSDAESNHNSVDLN